MPSLCWWAVVRRATTDKIDDPISGKKITVMIFANGSMNFLGGRSRQAIHDAYDAMTRKEEPLGFLREFGLGFSDVPPTPRGNGSNSSGMSPRASVGAAVAQTALSKDEVVEQAIAAAEDAVDDGDEEESKTLTVGMRRNLRRELLKCFADGDSEGDAKPWPLIEAKLQTYITQKRKSLKNDEMAAVLAGSLKRLLPRRDDDAAAAAAEERKVQAAAAAELAGPDKTDQAATAAPAAATAFKADAGSAPPPSPAGAGAGDKGSHGGAGVKRKADAALADLTPKPAAHNAAGATAEQGAGAPGQEGLHSVEGARADENKPQPVRLGVGQTVKFAFGGATGGGGASKKRKKGKAFGFAPDDDDD